MIKGPKPTDISRDIICHIINKNEIGECREVKPDVV